MSYFDYQDAIIYQGRKGTVEDPFIDIKEDVFINKSNKAVLTEIPDKTNRVRVLGKGVEWVETDERPTQNQYKVDYIHGVITFNSSRALSTLEFDYKGVGQQFFPASRVWTESDGTTIFATIEDSINRLETHEAIQAEKQRVLNELERIANEQLRINSELGRETNEDNRELNEVKRITNEDARLLNEQERLEKYDGMIETTVKVYKRPVSIYGDIATEYPNPENGWTVALRDTNEIYRYNDKEGVWQWIDMNVGDILEDATLDQISINAQSITGINQDLYNHINSELPHMMSVDNKSFKYGFEQSNGFVKFIYEEVI